jgi:hypothetical protein
VFAAFASATDRDSYMLRYVPRTDTNEYIGVADNKGRVRVRTKPCRFQPADSQTALFHVFQTPTYMESHIKFEGVPTFCMMSRRKLFEKY